MKRRKFGLLSASSFAAITAASISQQARAAVSADKAALLKTTLTPLGAERAGNADGSIPAWTGGVTTVPAGWTADTILMPDIYADEKATLTITAANMDQYKSLLSTGLMALMQKYGYQIDVYPTHRSAACPQFVYDNTYQNALNAKPSPQGARFGFSGAYGGTPFPIPDEDENQGAEIIWNHLARWFSSGFHMKISTFTVNQGIPALGATIDIYDEFPYYDPNGSLATFNGINDRSQSFLRAPPPLYGQEVLQINYTNPVEHPEQTWQLLPGQGRVRKAPELAFDTPSPGSSGLLNFDEVRGFFGSPERYNWKCEGKAEMFIPYNNNKQFIATPQQILLPHFPNPEFTRWEKHRVWIVEGTLAPGERNVVARRRFYVDEDTWAIVLADEYDAQGNLWKVGLTYSQLRPDLPGVIFGGGTLFDIQTDQYNHGGVPWNDPNLGSPITFGPIPAQMFNPQTMAAQAQY